MSLVHRHGSMSLVHRHGSMSLVHRHGSMSLVHCHGSMSMVHRHGSMSLVHRHGSMTTSLHIHLPYTQEQAGLWVALRSVLPEAPTTVRWGGQEQTQSQISVTLLCCVDEEVGVPFFLLLLGAKWNCTPDVQGHDRSWAP